MFGEGISKIGSLLDLAVDGDIVKKSGSWYSYNDERLGQGRENSKEFLLENPDVAKNIDQQVREHFKIPFEDANAQKESKAADKKPEKVKKD